MENKVSENMLMKLTFSPQLISDNTIQKFTKTQLKLQQISIPLTQEMQHKKKQNIVCSPGKIKKSSL